MRISAFDWPEIGTFTAEDAHGRRYTVSVRQNPGENGHTFSGAYHIPSEGRAFFVGNIPLHVREEGVFALVTDNKIIRKI